MWCCRWSARSAAVRYESEGEHRGQGTDRGGARSQPRQHGLVAKMDAIEIADGDGLGAAGAVRQAIRADERAVGHQHGAMYLIEKSSILAGWGGFGPC
jgi:hypothetical protein